ncbi:MAG: patatin-like phospholipase family protein [Candidatus Sumerlaeaceae bacterium]|nr:patatin-like phospholipase family protein [Candidatus Sumerlaeaceae bacterium]
MNSRPIKHVSRVVLSSTARILAVLVAAAFLASCATMNDPAQRREMRQNFVASTDTNVPLAAGHERVDINLSPSSKKDPLVFLTISGGGSRSAYYAACVMEQLSQIQAPGSGRSLLENVRVISTVSAGGLAASWYLAHYDQRHAPGFYDDFKKAMAVNLQWRAYGHMVWFPPLALQLLGSSLTRTDLLANEIEKLIWKRPETFDDLRQKEMRASDPAPVLILNGTVYNSGQRLVMTNLPARRFPTLVNENAKNIAISPKDEVIFRSLVTPLTFEDFGSDIGQFRVSQAVAASAAYPILLAPFRLKVYKDCVPADLAGRATPELLNSPWLHVADGGLYENLGIDPILNMMKTVDRNQPVMMIVIEADQRMETYSVERNKSWGPFAVLMRIYDIGTLRPLLLYGDYLRRIHNEDKLKTVIVRLEGYDDHTDNLLKKIPTAFKLSKSHQEALDEAARENVQHASDALVGYYRQLIGGGKATKPAKKYAETH